VEVRIRWRQRFHFASSGRMAVGEGGHLLLHRLSTRLASDDGGGRRRVGLVGCGCVGEARRWALRASGVRVVRAQCPPVGAIFLEREGQHDRSRTYGSGDVEDEDGLRGDH
jgi:hypothetical protein